MPFPSLEEKEPVLRAFWSPAESWHDREVWGVEACKKPVVHWGTGTSDYTVCPAQFPPSEALLTIHRTSETLQPPTATDMSDKFNQYGDTKLQEHGIY